MSANSRLLEVAKRWRSEKLLNSPGLVGNDPVSTEEPGMPVISMFYGIIVSMYFLDNRQHKMPHIHAKYQDSEAVLSIPEGELLDGSLPPAKLRLVSAWIEIHRDDLMANWELAVTGQQLYKIDPLR